MATIPFVGPSYNLTSRVADVQRTINLVPVPQEPGNERTKWVFQDVPGLVRANLNENICLAGPTWSAATTPNHRYQGIAYGNGVYVLCRTADPSAAYSTNAGLTYSDSSAFPGSPPGTHNDAIAFGNGIFMCIARATDVFYQSANGVTWINQPTNAPGVGIQAGHFTIYFDGTNFNAIGTQVGPDWVIYITNGTTLSYVVVPVEMVTGIYSNGNHKVSAASGQNVYRGTSIATLALAGATTNTFATKRLAANGANLIALPNGQQAYVSYSLDDGTTWLSSTGLASGFYEDCIYAQGRFIMTERAGGKIFFSPTGAVWTEAVSNLSTFETLPVAWILANNGFGSYAAVPQNASNSTNAAIGVC